MIYAWRYPESIHRSVMIAVNPPGHFLWDGKTTDEQIGRYAEHCSKMRAAAARTDDLVATMRRTAADIPTAGSSCRSRRERARRLLLRAHGDDANAAEGPLSRPMTLDAWLAAADGDASGFWFQSLLADLVFPGSFVWGQMAAAARPDAAGGDRVLLLRQPEA